MRSIAIINQKGGVGKTTTAVNLSAALAAQGSRVCLVDLDPQAHASLHLGLALDGGDPSIYDVLTGDASIAEVRHRLSDNLSLVPSQIDLAAAEMELAGEVGRELILRTKLEADHLPIDYLIIDCPPSLGVLTLNALAAVEEVLLPMQAHFLALHGLSQLLSTIKLVSQRINPSLHLMGVLFCMYDAGTRLAAEVSGDVTQFFAESAQTASPWSNAGPFQTRIRRNIRLAEAPSFGQAIFDYAPQSNGAADYLALSEELVAAGQAVNPTSMPLLAG